MKNAAIDIENLKTAAASEPGAAVIMMQDSIFSYFPERHYPRYVRAY